jgi:dipeptidyl-peptidase 4
MNRSICLAFLAFTFLAPAALGQGTPTDYERSARLAASTRDKVFRDSVEPHWFANNSKFWYRVDVGPGAHEFIVVEPEAEAGKRGPAFDRDKLAAALAKAAGKDVTPTRLPFDYIAVDGDAIRFVAFDKGWAFDNKNATIAEGPKPPPPPQPRKQPGRPGGGGGNFDRQPRVPSGNNPWTATVRNSNLFLRKGKEDEFQLTKDGTASDGYSTSDLYWSPDFSHLIALRTQKGEEHKIYEVRSSPPDQVQPKLITLDYMKPGDKLPIAKPHLFDLKEKKEIPVSDELFPNPWSITRLRWDADGKAFTFLYNQRGHQALRLLEINAETGKVRPIINEESKTFIDYAAKQFLHEVPGTGECIWMSERDGWNHLYLIDRKTGTVKNQITKGEWVVRAVDRVDDQARQIWFQASGIYPEQDPYFVHFCRINYDGTGLVKLTEGDGTHAIRYSPDQKYFLDNYSRVDMPPVNELRRADDGKLICALEKGDMSPLVKSAWKVPERFVAKGRDGKTDIYGVIYRPTNFDPNKKYAVIEQIYAGPQSSFVPKTFRAFHYPQEIAELGFITVQIDGMGTSNRSKAFHDVCCKNLADAGFPDRILWMKAAAQKYPYMDLSRVGVYGGSAGGQNALGALLFHGDFYKAAAADCGCHDNRMDKVWWNELWMGYPVGPHYAEQSNVTNAHKLTGKLLLTVGEVDSNVDPASTMQVVNALIKANKDFELVVFPNGNHGAGGSPYGARRRKDFFVKNLLGVEPPDRNSPRIIEPPKTPAEPKKDLPEPKKPADPKPVEKAKDTPPPDLAALIAKPGSEVRSLSPNFEADRGALMRKYAILTAADDYARLRKFHNDWLAAVDRLPSADLSEEGKADLVALRKRVESSGSELDDGYRREADVAPLLLPFRAELVGLEFSRRRLDPIDPVKLAAELTALRKKIDDTRETFAKELAKGNIVLGVFLTKARAERSAESVGAIRAVFKSWYGFYAGYDPMFTWWTAAPYKEVDGALEKYASLLKEKSAGRPTEDKPVVNARIEPRPIASGPSDLPDAKALLAKPSEMAGVIQRYQVDFRGGRMPGFGGKDGDRQARLAAQCESWLAALEKIEFDKLSHTGQVDYVLLRNTLMSDLARAKNPTTDGPGRPRRPKDSDEIVGRPIGREALLAALASEMIPYSPEQLVEMANREYAWCEAEMKKASREMGFGDDWHKALEKVKTLHAPPGGQPKVIQDLANEAIAYVSQNSLVTVPPVAAETWRMTMMSPEQQKFSPFFLGGEVIMVSFPTDTMSHDAKLQSMRGNNPHFSKATVHHELIPGHHLQQFMVSRYQPQRGMFSTPFWTEGWAVYWEMVLYEKGFPKTPEDRIGFMFWRMHRCARITFSLGFHLGKMSPQECIDFLVDKVGHERENATAEVRRSFAGAYPPLYQAGYLVGAKQFWSLRQELVVSGKMSERQFHDAILKESHMPVDMVRAAITDSKLTRDYTTNWKFLGDLPAAEWPKRAGAPNQQ